MRELVCGVAPARTPYLKGSKNPLPLGVKLSLRDDPICLELFEHCQIGGNAVDTIRRRSSAGVATFLKSLVVAADDNVCSGDQLTGDDGLNGFVRKPKRVLE